MNPIKRQQDVRRERGEAIAELCQLERRGDLWFVPSQSSGGKHTVRLDPNLHSCSCADWELREMNCKHIFAVLCWKARTVTPTAAPRTPEEVAVKRPTYRQVWPAYNKAQMNEKDQFQTLLADLCRGVNAPVVPRKRGRQPVLLSDALFAAVFKVYSTVSGRRFTSDLREAQTRGHLTKALHYNSVFKCLEDPKTTDVLYALVTRTSLPLKAVEIDFACDSTGFMASRFVRWFDQKYGAPRKKAMWVKAHAMVGVRTNVVTAVEIHEPYAGDAPQLPALVDATAANFTIREVSADKGYSSGSNHDAIAKHNGTPYIAFKNNTTAAGGGLFEQMWHFFSLNREEFLRRYHKRSNVETTFSMIKAKFGDSVRSKTDVAMKNEVLAKIVCHNIVCVIHETYELGIRPAFWPDTAG